MIPFNAIYRPTKFKENYPDGLDDEKEETVLVIKIFYDGAAAFIGADGRLDIARLEHFSDCEWRTN